MRFVAPLVLAALSLVVFGAMIGGGRPPAAPADPPSEPFAPASATETQTPALPPDEPHILPTAGSRSSPAATPAPAERSEVPVADHYPSTFPAPADASAAAATDTTPAPAGPPDDETERFIARMQNNSFSLDQREAEIAAMRRSRATDATRTLMALGDAEIYLSHKAIEALGWRHEAGVAEYLQGKLGCQDINSAVAAVKSLAQVQGEEAIPAIAELLENSRERSDGYQARIWASCADALAQLASAQSIGLLNRELRWVSGGSLQLEYGSQLVRAVYDVGRGGGVEPLENYAAALEAKKPAEAMPRKYYEDKIQEARETAAKLKANPRSPD